MACREAQEAPDNEQLDQLHGETAAHGRQAGIHQVGPTLLHPCSSPWFQRRAPVRMSSELALSMQKDVQISYTFAVCNI